MSLTQQKNIRTLEKVPELRALYPINDIVESFFSNQCFKESKEITGLYYLNHHQSRVLNDSHLEMFRQRYRSNIIKYVEMKWPDEYTTIYDMLHFKSYIKNL